MITRRHRRARALCDCDLLLAAAAIGDAADERDDTKHLDPWRIRILNRTRSPPHADRASWCVVSLGVHPRFPSPTALAAAWIYYYCLLYGTLLLVDKLLSEA